MSHIDTFIFAALYLLCITVYHSFYWSAVDQVTGGTVNIDVSPTGFFSFVKKHYSVQLCSVLPTGCPVKKGQTTITTTKTLPNSIPSVSVSG